MRKQQDLSYKLLQELSIWKGKVEELEKLIESRPNGMSVRDMARRAKRIFKNGASKAEAIEEMASKE